MKITLILTLLLMFPRLLAQESDKTSIEITSNNGKSFLAEIIEVDDESVKVKRASDRKNFQLSLDILDQATRNTLNDWKKKNRVWPLQEVIANSFTGKAAIHVPEGEINFLHDGSNRTHIKYNSGYITLHFFLADKSYPRDYTENTEKAKIPKELGALTPDERKKFEKTIRVEEREAGKWRTYRLTGLPPRRESNYWRVRFSKGNIHGRVDVNKTINGRAIGIEEVYRIVGTIRIRK